METKIVAYKVKDIFEYRRENGVIKKKEEPQHWFASFVAKELRNYLDGQNAKITPSDVREYTRELREKRLEWVKERSKQKKKK